MFVENTNSFTTLDILLNEQYNFVKNVNRLAEMTFMTYSRPINYPQINPNIVVVPNWKVGKDVRVLVNINVGSSITSVEY